MSFWFYVAGNVAGRLLASYLAVWLVCLLMSRGHWRRSVALTVRWPALLAIAVLLLAGLAGTAGPMHGIVAP